MKTDDTNTNKTVRSLSDDSLYTIPDTARFCQVSERTVRRWITRRELIAYKLGNQLRIAPYDLDVFMKLRRQA